MPTPLATPLPPGRGHETLLTPDTCVLVLIDHQPQMAFAVQSIDRQLMISNTVALAKSAKLFGVPTVLTTVSAEGFSGAIFSDVQAVFPEQRPIDRSTMNPWEDQRVVDAVRATGRRTIVMAGLWTEVCVALPALSALAEGWSVVIVEDACGGTSAQAHDASMRRMETAGAVPTSWLTWVLELQRDWARGATAGGVFGVAAQHGGAYGLGGSYYMALAQRGQNAAGDGAGSAEGRAASPETVAR
jgi:nicotinamidase-related amidase